MSFLHALKCGDIDDENTRRGIINIFLRAVYLYDDRMTLFFNGGEQPIILDDVLLDEIEEHFESAVSYHKKCSPLVADAPPQSVQKRLFLDRFFIYNSRITSKKRKNRGIYPPVFPPSFIEERNKSADAQ